MTDYLPKDATIEQACNWLRAKTGQTWSLPRLLECGLMPHFWLDYSPGQQAIFGDRLEGLQSRMMFHGDLTRLASSEGDALVTMLESHDGQLIKVSPGLKVALPELRFKRSELESLAAELSEAPANDAGQACSTGPEPAAPVAGTGKRWTPEKLADLKAYRASHTGQETAAKFGISEQRIRQLLPSNKPQSTPFARLIHRTR